MSRNARHRPRIYTAPPGIASTGIVTAEVFDALHESAGRPLDLWQRRVLETGLRRPYPAFQSRHPWAATEVGVLAGRQNGKTVTAEARELGGAVLLDENVVHTYPSREISHHTMTRMAQIVTSTPALARQVHRMWWTVGDERIEFRNGASIRYMPRTSRTIDAARNADLLVLDHAVDIDTGWWAMAMATEDPDRPRTRPRQVWYLGTAVDRARHPRGEVFSQIRHRGLTGTDPNLCWLEYSAPDDRDENGKLLIDPTSSAALEMGNPSPRLSHDKVREMHRVLAPGLYESEFLGIGNWFEPWSAA